MNRAVDFLENAKEEKLHQTFFTNCRLFI